MHTVLQPDHIELLKNIHLSCNTSADDIDEPKYTLQKKLSEVCDHVDRDSYMCADFCRFCPSWETRLHPILKYWPHLRLALH